MGCIVKQFAHVEEMGLENFAILLKISILLHTLKTTKWKLTP
jgi:hypothetical protein